MTSPAPLKVDPRADGDQQLFQAGQQFVGGGSVSDALALTIRIGNAIAAACATGGDIDLLALLERQRHGDGKASV